ncbi:MAG: hypothetical protein AB7V22_03355 [Kiritimatiellia bacterium]
MRTLGRWVAGMAFGLGLAASAAPVARDDAFRAAETELPRFYPGDWAAADEVPLVDLSDTPRAYAFIFARAGKRSAAAETPAAFVAQARASIAAAGASATGYETELRGEDRYATIVVAADDAEPPVLRCHLGLPGHVVREANALALAGRARRGVAWRVRRPLMLGFFDEAFVLEPVSGTGEALVVDLRTQAAVPEREAKARAQLRQAVAPDPERERLCQEAWQPYRTAKATAVIPLATPAGANGGTP